MNRPVIFAITIAVCVAAVVLPVIAGPPDTVAVHGLTGATVRPLAKNGQKATCLLFVAHDCPISNKYVPEYNRIVKEYRPKRIAFYVVYCEYDGKPADAKKHHRDFGYSCPGLLDPRQSLVKQAGATVTPEAAVFDSSGNRIYLGRIDNLYEDLGKPRFAATQHDLRRALDAIVAGKPVPVKTTKPVGCFIYRPN